MGLPFQLEGAEAAVAVLFQVEVEGGGAEAHGEIGPGSRRAGADAPAGGGSGGERRTRRAQQKPQGGGDAAPAAGRPQGETSGGGEIESARTAGDLGDGGGGAATGERLLAGPQRLVLVFGGDLDQARGIEAEGVETGGMEATALAAGLGGGDPDDAAVAAIEEAGEEGAGEADEGAVVTALVADAFVQRAGGEATGGAEATVDAVEAEIDGGLEGGGLDSGTLDPGTRDWSTLDRRGFGDGGQVPGARGPGAEIEAGGRIDPPLDGRDGAPQLGQPISFPDCPFHGRVVPSLVDVPFSFSMDSRTSKESQAAIFHLCSHAGSSCGRAFGRPCSGKREAGMGRREEIEAERRQAAAAALSGVARDGEGGPSFGARVGGHFAARDADPADRIEVWGRRIGRGLALIVAGVLIVHLVTTYGWR